MFDLVLSGVVGDLFDVWCWSCSFPGILILRVGFVVAISWLLS